MGLWPGALPHRSQLAESCIAHPFFDNETFPVIKGYSLLPSHHQADGLHMMRYCGERGKVNLLRVPVYCPRVRTIEHAAKVTG